MKKIQEPRKKWLIYLDYLLLPASSFFAFYNYMKEEIGISIVFIFLVVMSIGRLIKDRKVIDE